MLLGTAILLSGMLGTGDAAYLREQVEAYASVASNRPVDGLDYYADKGVWIAGLRYAHPEGLYAASQLVSGEGDGHLLPAVRSTSLESALGWSWRLDAHGISFEIQDYRLSQSDYPDQDYRGVALHYYWQDFSAELGHEADRAFYYEPLDRFFHYDKNRLVLAYQLPVSGNAAIRISAGRHHIRDIDVRYGQAAARLDLHWRHWNAWLGYSVVSDDVEAFYSGDADRHPVTLGISTAFDLD